MTLIETTLSIVKMRRNKWKKGSEDHCTGILSTTCRCLLRRQVQVNLIPKCRPYGSTFNPMADLHSETGKHQDQVKVLIERTASSLDDTALKMLFVSVQRNNIEISVKCAIYEYEVILFMRFDNDLFQLDPQDPGDYNCLFLSLQFK